MLATATAARKVREGTDFFPLTVDIEERMYAAGKIPGSFFRREGRATDQAILTARLIDRPLRPSFPEGFRNEVHIVGTILGADQLNPHDVLSINAASAALMISGIPFTGPIGAVRIAYSTEGTWLPHCRLPGGRRLEFELVVAGRALGLHAIPELATLPGPLYLAIGVFDGVHLGHRSVLLRALPMPAPVAATPSPSPSILTPPKSFAPPAPRASSPPPPTKLRLIRALGIDSVLVIPFTKQFADTPPEDFVHQLHAACHPLREICVGHEWCFGRGRKGNLEMLRQMGDRFGFDEVGIPAVRSMEKSFPAPPSAPPSKPAISPAPPAYSAATIPSSAPSSAATRLAAPLGFPTANLSAHNEQFPPNGVYAVTALWRDLLLKGVVNLGVRPTIDSATGERLLEFHLFDFDQELYGEDIEVTFRSLLRPEQKFPSRRPESPNRPEHPQKARLLLA